MQKNRALLYLLMFLLFFSLIIPVYAQQNNYNYNQYNQNYSQNYQYRRNINLRLTLTPTDRNSTATGNVRIIANMNNNLYSVQINSTMSRVTFRTDRAYEAWLIDSNTNYNLSLGAFNGNRRGNTNFNFQQNMVNFTIYDKFAISEEPINDTNPAPSRIILQANINTGSQTGQEVRNIRVNLDGKQEVPSNNSAAQGTAYFTIDTRNNTLKYNIQFQGLEGTETSANINGPADTGQNANILFTLPMGRRISGTWNYNQNQEQDILNGRTYVNIHSSKYPDGEIRAQIK